MAGEMLASAVVKEVVKTLSSRLQDEIGLLWNFTNDLEKMKGTLTTLEAVLMDAEKRSRQGEEAVAVRLWLKRLKSAAYDIEELLLGYESNIPVKKEKILDKAIQTLRVIFSGSNPAILTVKMAHKIKGMRKRLNTIAVDRLQFKFTDDFNYVEQHEIVSRATTSLLNESDETTIVGRDKEKEKLISLLIKAKEEANLDIIAIVGFGGLGKTTLARLIFNDERVKRSFNLRAWVYISMKFDFKKIVVNLIECFKNSRGNPGLFQTVEAACLELQELLKGKRFLIVLDDLWEDDWQKLDKLKEALRDGMKSSKVILTTRDGRIATLMGATQPHFIEFLSDEHCWDLFSKRAFRSDVERGNLELVEIGKEIVNRCKGMPLAAKALGVIMQFNVGVNYWKSVRDSDFWKLDEEDESIKTMIFQSLKLSYYNMRSYLKRCFAYCSIFSQRFQHK